GGERGSAQIIGRNGAEKMVARQRISPGDSIRSIGGGTDLIGSIEIKIDLGNRTVAVTRAGSDRNVDRRVEARSVDRVGDGNGRGAVVIIDDIDNGVAWGADDVVVAWRKSENDCFDR